MSILRWLIYKDLTRFLADRQGALMALMVPVVLASLLGMLFAPSTSTGKIALIVVDADRGEAARAFVQELREHPGLTVAESEADAARERVRRGDAGVALFLPPGISANLRPAAMFAGAKKGAMELVYDPAQSVQADIVTGLLTQTLMQQLGAALADPVTTGAMFDELRADLDDQDARAVTPQLRAFLDAGSSLSAAWKDVPAAADDAAAPDASRGMSGGMQMPVTFDKVAMANPGELSGYNSYAQNFAGMLVLFLLFTGQGEAKNLHGERSRGSLMRLRMSRARPWQILLGSGLSVAIIALVVSLLVYAVGMLVFGVRIRGSLVGFGAMLVAQALFVGGFSLLLAGLGRTEQQIGSVGTFVILVLAFAGGATIPSFLMPDWLQLVGHALPTYWATRGFAAMTWRGLPLGEGLLAASMLTGFALGCGALGMWRFRWESH